MHVEFDELTLLAAGEDRPQAQAHIADCATCQAELEELRAVVERVRSTGPTDPVPAEQMPSGLWERIRAEVTAEIDAEIEAGCQGRPGAGSDPAAAPSAHAGGPAADGSKDAELRLVAGAGSEQDHAEQVQAERDQAELDEADRRSAERSFRWYVAGIAAVAGLGAGALLTSYVSNPNPAFEVLAVADLGALQDDLPAGNAELIERGGRQILVVETEDDPSTDGDYLEVWLVNEEITGLITLGPLDAERQEFLVPPDLDLSEFTVVDISREPLDGDPTHSGDSLWRGALAFEGDADQ